MAARPRRRRCIGGARDVVKMQLVSSAHVVNVPPHAMDALATMFAPTSLDATIEMAFD